MNVFLALVAFVMADLFLFNTTLGDHLLIFEACAVAMYGDIKYGEVG